MASYSVVVFGYRLQLTPTTSAVLDSPMTMLRQSTVLEELGKPQSIISIACLSLTLLAAYRIWQLQTAPSPRTSTASASSRDSNVAQTRETTVERPGLIAQPNIDESSDLAKTSRLISVCTALLSRIQNLEHVAAAGQQHQRDVRDLIFKITAILCRLQGHLVANPDVFSKTAGAAAVFETTSQYILTTSSDVNARNTENLPSQPPELLLSRLRNISSALDFIDTSIASSPTTRQDQGRVESSAVIPDSDLNLLSAAPLLQPAITPGQDVKDWLGGPPKLEIPLESEPLPEYTVLPVPTASPSKSNNAVKRSVVSLADIHKVLASEAPEDGLGKLFSSGVDPNAAYGRLSRTALHEAARLNKPDCIDVIVHAGALVDAEDGKGDAALHLATWEGHVEASTCLLDYGAQIDRLSGRDGGTALLCAIGGRHIDMVRLLLRRDARTSLRSSSEMYPLHQAAVTGQSAMCEALLAAGAAVDVRDKDGNTPLHNAAAIGSVASVRVLLENEAQIDAATNQGMTALHWASHKGHNGLVKVLLDAGADEDVREQGGATPLCCAAGRGHIECVKELLQYGANPKLQCEDWNGNAGTPVQLARRNGHRDVVALLKNDNSSGT